MFGSETDTNPILWFFVGIFHLRVIEGEFRGNHSELRVAVQSFQTVRRKVLLWVPITNLASRTHAEDVGIKAGNVTDPAFFRENCTPKILASESDEGDWPTSGTYNACLTHPG